MKWILKLIVAGLVTGLLVYLFHLYPFAWPLLVHRPPGWLYTLLNDYVIATQTPAGRPDLFIVLVFSLALSLVMFVHVKLFSRTTNYGSAGFMGWLEAGRFAAPIFSGLFGLLFWILRVPFFLVLVTFRGAGALGRGIYVHQQNVQAGNAPAASRLVIGACQGRTIFLNKEQQQEHVLMTAPTGSGKSSEVIIPNLLREEGARSVFIADLMDELYPLCAGALARCHQVWRFAPVRPSESQGYNPLAAIEDARDAWMVANCWVENTGRSKESYWDDCARLLISALAMHLHQEEPDAPFSRLSDILAQMPYEQLKQLLSDSPSEAVRRFAGPFINYMTLNERLVGSIMTTIINRFQVMNSDEVRMVTAKNEIDFQRMVEVPTALFLSIPSDETGFHRPLLASFTMQMFRTWRKRVNRSQSRRLPVEVACYLDEFGNLGSIPDFPAFISTARHFGVCLFMAIQNFSQLSASYGKEGEETIMNNAKTHLVFPGAGLRETEYYSKRIGEATVGTQTYTTTEAGSASRNSWTQSETGRPLMTPDEIRTMSSHSILMVPASFKPLLLKAKRYYEDPRLARLANLPYHPQWVRVQPEPPASSGSTLGLPGAQQANTAASQPSSSVSQEDDDEQHFLHK
jgi:type IV secretion system protein VirD4